MSKQRDISTRPADPSRRNLLLSGSLALANGGRVQASVQRIRVALAARFSLFHLPLTLADQLGYLRRAGWAVDWLPLESGAQALAHLQSGQADVLSGSFDHAFATADKGPAPQAFFMFARTPQISLGLSTRLSMLAQGTPALRGSRIGISARNSGTHWVASQWVYRAGLLPDEVQYIEVGAGATAVEALRSGQIDLLCNPEPQMTGLELRGELVLVAETRSLSGTRKLFGGLVPGSCLLTLPETLQRQTPMIQALCDGMVMALKWLRTAGPTDILRTVPSPYWMGDRAVYLGALERLREAFFTDGQIDGEAVMLAWRHHQKLLVQGRVLSAPPGRTYTNEFAQKARQRLV
jgi:NitT/TauT family transport system substrate-binding protein